jgi:hypothetical protein
VNTGVATFQGGGVMTFHRLKVLGLGGSQGTRCLGVRKGRHQFADVVSSEADCLAGIGKLNPT